MGDVSGESARIAEAMTEGRELLNEVMQRAVVHVGRGRSSMPIRLDEVAGLCALAEAGLRSLGEDR